MRKFSTNWVWPNSFIPIVLVVLLLILVTSLIPGKVDAPHESSEKIQEDYSVVTVTFPKQNTRVVADISDTAKKRTLGLSGRESLPDGRGMLFIFDTPGIYGFWMKDMNFAIDILWFDENMKLVDMWQNATPDSYPKAVEPRSPAKYVLEVPQGFAEAHLLQIGDGMAF